MAIGIVHVNLKCPIRPRAALAIFHAQRLQVRLPRVHVVDEQRVMIAAIAAVYGVGALTDKVQFLRGSQPIPRSDLGISMLLGVWGSVLIPTTLLSLVGMVAIHEQMGEWPELGDAILFLVATGMLLFWYASIQLLASSWAKDMGGAIAWGIGTWMMFTMVWVLVTVLVAGILGVEVGDTSDSQYQQLSVWVDLFSPNGVYQMLLESNLDGGLSRRIDSLFVWIAALLWSIIPTWLFLRRFERIQ